MRKVQKTFIGSNPIPSANAKNKVANSKWIGYFIGYFFENNGKDWLQSAKLATFANNKIVAKPPKTIKNHYI